MTARRVRVGLHVVSCTVTGTGPAALLLHGWPQTKHAWRKMIPLLAPHRTLVVPDLPGFGTSSRPASGYDKRSVAEVLASLMQSLGHREYDIVGHDVGGQVAFPLAAEHRDVVRSLTFVEAGIPGLGRSVESANPLTGGSWHFGFNMVPDLPELLIRGREREFLHWMFHRDSIGLVVEDAIRSADLDHYAHALAAPGAARSTFAHYRALPSDLAHNVELAQQPLHTPTLVVGARHGVGLSWLDTVEAVAPAARSEWVEDCGHYVPEEQPAALAELVLQHWTQAAEERS